MSFLTDFINNVFNTDIRTTIITLILGFVVYKISKFYLRVLSLPPGPIPIPLLGNILYLRGTKQHWTIELEKLADKYGPVFTFWLGKDPVVFIADIDLGREAFRKNDFAGRAQNMLSELASNQEYTDIVSADYGQRWEALRRVSHSAVQKYSTTDKLIYLVSDCVDHTIKTIIEKEGYDKPFVPFDYIHYTFLNILGNSAFGKRYQMDDPEYKALKYFQNDIFEEYGQKLLFLEMIPILRLIDRKTFKMIKNLFAENVKSLEEKFQSHYKDYDESVIRDFCDTLITSKNEAIKAGKESAPYLTDKNLALSIFDLFFAGTDTSQMTFRWILFFIKYYPEVEIKLRQEIENQIGDRIPTHEDRNNCHYVMAVISEVLRFRNIIPQGVNHKAVVTSKIGEHTIPKDTQITVLQGNILHNEKYWPNANQFIPERFLENGKYITTQPKAFIPFGVGRRVCLGEKLAIADLFLVLVRFLQSTSDVDIVLHYDYNDTEPDPNDINEINPKSFKISLKKK